MSDAGCKMIAAAEELLAFARDENTAPMTLYMPDGDGGFVSKQVRNMDEYRAAWHGEGVRVIREASARAPTPR